MAYLNGVEVVVLGVYRTWFRSPQEAVEDRGMYGKMSTKGMSHGGVLDLIRAMEAVMQAAGDPEQFKVAFQTADGVWHDYGDDGESFDGGPD